MNTAILTAGLTTNDIKAMRQADRICFFHSPGEGGSIKAIKEVRNADPFAERERSHEIAVATSFRGQGAGNHLACFEMFHTSRFNEEWMTIASFVKVGDEITLEWYRDAKSNGYCERTTVQSGPGCGMELHGDALYLKIRRGDKRFSFLVSVSICPDNTARMIRA